MPILPLVGRKSAKIRVVIIGMYVILTLGGLTMLYPFMITLTSSVSNVYDYEKYYVVPKYLFDEDERYLKYIAEKYYAVSRHFSHPFSMFASSYNISKQWASFRDISFEEDVVQSFFTCVGYYPVHKEEVAKIFKDYEGFMKGYDKNNCELLFYRESLIKYQGFLQKKYKDLYLLQNNVSRHQISEKVLKQRAIDLLNDTHGEGRYDQFEIIPLQKYSLYLQTGYFPDTPRVSDYREFVETRAVAKLFPITGKYLWNRYLSECGDALDELNKRWGTDYKSFYEIPFFTQSSNNEMIRKDFEKFMQERYPLRLLKLKEGLESNWQDFLKKRIGSIERYNRLCKTEYYSWEEVPFYRAAPENVLERNYWNEFVISEVPFEKKIFHSAEKDYQEFLEKKYNTMTSLNQVYGKAYLSFSEIQIPFPEIDYYDYITHEGEHLGKFLTFNFIEVLRFITIQGRALSNTVVLITLTILATLTVNPLAAYALSRYRLRFTQQIFVFLLATMAFPSAVTMIPGFLLLRDLHLLNTFGALVLPGIANGFSIFLLKGFFDSLPAELYESAAIDGAKETTMFWHITLPLCKPILAVIALNAFISAYGGFMWAFLVCQNERMWTLMVWLYQFQQLYRNMPYMVMAGLVIASIPTLLVFIFCQRIILRGIIIPAMK